MFELKEESYRIPWLIWIQLIVFLLLLVLLFFFTEFPVDPDDDNPIATITAPATASASSKGFLFDEIQQIDKPLTNHASAVPLLTNGQQRSQGGQNLNIKEEIGTDSSTRREEITEGESSSLNFHPCHYFQLATVAFLKCFGLDSTSDSSSNRRRRKRKEC